VRTSGIRFRMNLRLDRFVRLGPPRGGRAGGGRPVSFLFPSIAVPSFERASERVGWAFLPTPHIQCVHGFLARAQNDGQWLALAFVRRPGWARLSLCFWLVGLGVLLGFLSSGLSLARVARGLRRFSLYGSPRAVRMGSHAARSRPSASGLATRWLAAAASSRRCSAIASSPLSLSGSGSPPPVRPAPRALRAPRGLTPPSGSSVLAWLSRLRLGLCGALGFPPVATIGSRRGRGVVNDHISPMARRARPTLALLARASHRRLSPSSMARGARPRGSPPPPLLPTAASLTTTPLLPPSPTGPPRLLPSSRSD
jgi:hypothetical protein